MDWTDPRTSQAASAAPIEKQPGNPEIQCCNVIPLGANARQLRFGGGASELAAGDIPNPLQ